MRNSRTVSAAAVAATAMAVVGLAATPAQAANKDGRCEEFELCLWYSPDHNGSMIDLPRDPEHLDDRFITPGAGQGRVVGNNAASALNFNGSYWARIANKQSCTGPEKYNIPPYGLVENLGFMRNDNRSNCWPFPA